MGEMQTKELQNGRLAMLAAAGFMGQELVNHKPILETLKLLILLDDSEISITSASTCPRATSRRSSLSWRPRRRTRSSKQRELTFSLVEDSVNVAAQKGGSQHASCSLV